LKKVIREEIEWIEYKDYLVTSLLIWNDRFLPFQTIIFRKGSLMCRTFIKIDQIVYQEDFLIPDLRTNLEEEILFSITNYFQKVINFYTVSDYSDIEPHEADFDDPALKDMRDILKEILLDDIVLESLKQATPDFGFYSLSLNFNKLKMMIEKGRTPTLYEEVMRINKKHN